MWLTFCWSAVILAAVVGIGFALYGFKKRDQGLLSKGLVVFGSLLTVLGITGFLMTEVDGPPLFEAVATMVVIIAIGLICIVVGLTGLAKKDLFWKSKSQGSGPPQEKF